MNTKDIAMDTQPHELAVGLQWAVKERELLVVLPPEEELAPRVHFLDLFEPRYSRGVNLLETSKLQTGTTPHGMHEYPTFCIPELQTFESIKEEKCITKYNKSVFQEAVRQIVYRFIPFLPQNLACTAAKWDCCSCKFLYPCEMVRIPIGVLEAVDLQQASIHRKPKGVCSLFQAKVSSVPLYGPSDVDHEFFDYRKVCIGRSTLYGYGELFTEYPEFRDCFRLYSARRSHAIQRNL